MSLCSISITTCLISASCHINSRFGIIEAFENDFKTGLIIFLLIIGLISVWMNWEVVKASIDWNKHSQAFPLPFYLASPPIYFYIDLSYLLIVIVLGLLAYFSLKNNK